MLLPSRRPVAPPTPSYPYHAWLAAILPKDARSFRVEDPKLAAALAEAGGVLVDDAPDVEIAGAPDLRGDARRGVIWVERNPRDGVAGLARIAARFSAPMALSRDIKAARGGLKRRGYDRLQLATWEFGRSLRFGGDDQRRSLRERLPRNAAVVGDRPGIQRPETLLDAVEAQAGESHGGRIGKSVPGVRAGILVNVATDAVLRTAVGPARLQLLDQADALEQLRSSASRGFDESLIPWTIGRGRVGLADWSLEKKLPGSTPGWELDLGLVGPTLDFLVALHSCGGPVTERHSPAHDAEVAASFMEGERAASLRRIGQRVGVAVADLPHGFGHGDFFTRNILVDRGRLVGVVDWDAAGPNRPPLLDFIHLWHLGRNKVGDLAWGPTIVSDLLPWAREGGDEVLRSLAQRIDVDVSPSKLEALAIAYWLARVAYQLSRYADRAERPIWMRQNVDAVLHELSATGWR